MTQKVVWKFSLGAVQHSVQMPRGAEILTVAEQDGNITLWAAVDPEEELVFRNLTVLSTGRSCGEEVFNLPFLGTVFLGVYVFHIFDEGEV